MGIKSSGHFTMCNYQLGWGLTIEELVGFGSFFCNRVVVVCEVLGDTFADV